MIKKIFHFLNLLFIIFYIYPGSILGFIIYKDYTKQPEITPDIIFLSSNHVYAFLLLSLVGFAGYQTNRKNIIYYLFIISIVLELLHIVIPNRSFQFSDLFGNIVGVLISLIILILINFWRKKA